MTTVAGIEIEKNDKGQDAFVRIDLKKYKKQLQPFFKEVGLVANEDNEFERLWNNPNNLTIEQAKERTKKRLRQLWKETMK